MTTDPLLLEILERVRGRYYGKYRGVVADVDASTMRIKASGLAVLPGVVTGWCSPCVPYAGPNVGVLMLPEQGSGVWIEFEGGDVSRPIWCGCFWHDGEVPSAASAGVKTIVTAAGSLAFDNDGQSVTLQDAQSHSLVLDTSGMTATADTGKLALGSDGLNVNDGALEVQ